MTDDLLARARAEASDYIHQKHPWMYDRGIGIVQGSHYRGGFVDGATHGAEWVLAQLPDREAVARRIDPGAFTDWQNAHDPRHVEEGRQRQEAALIKADAVLDLMRNGGAE